MSSSDLREDADGAQGSPLIAKHPCILWRPCSSCSWCAWDHPSRGTRVALSEHRQHRPCRGAADGSSSWSRFPALGECTRMRATLHPSASAHASHHSLCLLRASLIHALMLSAHDSHSSLLWTLAKISEAPSTFSVRCACAVRSFCVIRLLRGTRTLGRCLSVCSTMRGLLASRSGNGSGVALWVQRAHTSWHDPYAGCERVGSVRKS